MRTAAGRRHRRRQGMGTANASGWEASVYCPKPRVLIIGCGGGGGDSVAPLHPPRAAGGPPAGRENGPRPPRGNEGGREDPLRENPAPRGGGGRRAPDRG